MEDLKKKIFYLCDFEKNIKCKKRFCQKKCIYTSNKEFAKSMEKVLIKNYFKE